MPKPVSFAYPACVHTPEAVKALRKLEPGRIAVFTVHGVPDYGHLNVTTPPELWPAAATA